MCLCSLDSNSQFLTWVTLTSCATRKETCGIAVVLPTFILEQNFPYYMLVRHWTSFQVSCKCLNVSEHIYVEVKSCWKHLYLPQFSLGPSHLISLLNTYYFLLKAGKNVLCSFAGVSSTYKLNVLNPVFFLISPGSQLTTCWHAPFLPHSSLQTFMWVRFPNLRWGLPAASVSLGLLPRRCKGRATWAISQSRNQTGRSRVIPRLCSWLCQQLLIISSYATYPLFVSVSLPLWYIQ